MFPHVKRAAFRTDCPNQLDANFKNSLRGARDLDAALKQANEAEFFITKADWLKSQAKQALEIGDEELKGVASGEGKCVMYGTCTIKKA